MVKKVLAREELKNCYQLLQPSRPILCTTLNEDGSNHVAPFSWVNPISCDPPRIAMALSSKGKKQHSLINVERTSEFVVNLPDMSIADRLVETSYSRKSGENKFDRSGFKALTSHAVQPVAIEECRAHLECRAYEIIDAGDHALILADIVGASYDEEAFQQSMSVNLLQYQPVVHVTNYCLDNFQLHIFLESKEAVSIEVPYPENGIGLSGNCMNNQPL